MRTRLLYLVASLALANCATSHPLVAPPPPPAVPVDMATMQGLNSLTRQNWLPHNLGGLELATLGLPPYLVSAPAGSSPRQRRQWQRAQAQNLARAGVLPAKIKNSNLATAPGAVAINQPRSPVATGAGTATDARKAGQRHGAGAIGKGARAEATDKSGGSPWWLYLLAAVVGAVSWEWLAGKVGWQR